MGPTGSSSVADSTQVGPLLAPWTLLSGNRSGAETGYSMGKIHIMTAEALIILNIKSVTPWYVWLIDSWVWNCFIPKESQVVIYHNQGVAYSLSCSPIFNKQKYCDISIPKTHCHVSNMEVPPCCAPRYGDAMICLWCKIMFGITMTQIASTYRYMKCIYTDIDLGSLLFVSIYVRD